jgi:hypothetical protein
MRYKGDVVPSSKCWKCGKSGHPSNKYFGKQNLVSRVKIERAGQNLEVVCFKCSTKCHYAKDCRRAEGKFNRRNNNQEKWGNRNVRGEPPFSQFHSVGCLSAKIGNFCKIKTEHKQGKGTILLGSGAYMSVVNSKKLIGTAEFSRRLDSKL